MGIGLSLVFTIFGPRGCGKWLPGNQVKKWIRENNQNIEVSQRADCQMKCQGLKMDDILMTIHEDGDGDVLFEEVEQQLPPRPGDGFLSNGYLRIDQSRGLLPQFLVVVVDVHNHIYVACAQEGRWQEREERLAHAATAEAEECRAHVQTSQRQT